MSGIWVSDFFTQIDVLPRITIDLQGSSLEAYADFAHEHGSGSLMDESRLPKKMFGDYSDKKVVTLPKNVFR